MQRRAISSFVTQHAILPAGPQCPRLISCMQSLPKDSAEPCSAHASFSVLCTASGKMIAQIKWRLGHAAWRAHPVQNLTNNLPVTEVLKCSTGPLQLVSASCNMCQVQHAWLP